MDGWMDGWMDGRRDGWMDGWTDGRTDGWMDVRIHACAYAHITYTTTPATFSVQEFGGIILNDLQCSM